MCSGSFGLVENKLYEADFFLDRFNESNYLSFEGSCYFSAFVSACRSVTFSLQACMKGIAGFDNWYKKAQNFLKADALAPYFIDVRNKIVHSGNSPLNKIPLDHLKEALSIQRDNGKKPHLMVIPNLCSNISESSLHDANKVSKEYFTSLVSIIYDCYSEFKTTVDPKWYFTEDNFEQKNKTFTDALEEMGFPKGWADALPNPISNGWMILRKKQPPNQLNPIFHKYLGKSIPGPDEVDA